MSFSACTSQKSDFWTTGYPLWWKIIFCLKSRVDGYLSTPFDPNKANNKENPCKNRFPFEKLPKNWFSAPKTGRILSSGQVGFILDQIFCLFWIFMSNGVDWHPTTLLLKQKYFFTTGGTLWFKNLFFGLCTHQNNFLGPKIFTDQL